MDYWFGFGICIVVAVLSFVLGYLRRGSQKPVGTLRIDTSDPDGPYLFLELHTPINEVMRHKIVTLDVNLESYISQK